MFFQDCGGKHCLIYHRDFFEWLVNKYNYHLEHIETTVEMHPFPECFYLKLRLKPSLFWLPCKCQ